MAVSIRSGPEPAWAERASRSGGPTPGVAPARAALRAAEAPHNFLNFDLVAEAYSSPPHGVAADCAIQRVAKARPTARPNPRPNSRRFVLGAPPRATIASLRPRTATLWVAKAKPKALPNLPPNPQPHARPSAARKPFPVFVPEEQSQPKARPNSPPRVSPTAAPLSLRRTCRRPRQFLPDWPSANRQNMPFKRAGDGVFARIKFFFARLARFIHIRLAPK